MAAVAADADAADAEKTAGRALTGCFRRMQVNYRTYQGDICRPDFN